MSCSQVAESIARKPVDYGRLVFVDPTTTRCAQKALTAAIAEQRCTTTLQLSKVVEWRQASLHILVACHSVSVSQGSP